MIGQKVSLNQCLGNLLSEYVVIEALRRHTLKIESSVFPLLTSRPADDGASAKQK